MCKNKKIEDYKFADSQATPDRLDIPVEVFNFRAWIIWLGILIMFTLIILWCSVGLIDERVKGKGIILPEPEKVYKCVAKGDGQISKVLVNISEKVKKGQPIAYLDMELLEDKIKNTDMVLRKIEEFLDKNNKFIQEQKDMLGLYSNNFYKALEIKKANAEKYEDFMNVFLKKAYDLFKKHAISAVTYEEYTKAYYGVINEVLDTEVTRSNKALSLASTEFSWIRDIVKMEFELINEKYRIEMLKSEYQQQHIVRSPIDGIVNQIDQFEGSYATAGSSIATIVSTSERNDVLAYFPTISGKKISKGMNTYISPTITKKELYGTIRGKVLSITEFPVPKKEIAAWLKDEELADYFTKDGTPLMCKIELDKGDTVSGYNWTSGEGPQYKITDGTICGVSVVTERRHPIVLLFPFLEKLFGLKEF